MPKPYWQNYCFSLLLGLLLVLALPPFYIFPVIFVAFPIFLYLLSQLNVQYRQPKTKAFLLGWWFGMGYFTGGLYWIANALFVDIGSFWWLLPFSLLGLPAVLSLYIGATALVTYLCRTTPLTQWLSFAISWSLFEWLRGLLFTGFPWNPISSIWHEQLYLVQSLSLFGTEGLGFLTVLLGSLPFLLIKTKPRSQVFLATAVVLIIMGGLSFYGMERLKGNPTQYTTTKVRLVQPNIQQISKFNTPDSDSSLQKLLHLSQQNQNGINLILWPETAAAFLLEFEEEKRQQMAQAVPIDGALITGTLRAAFSPEQQTYDKWNSIQAIDRSGTVIGTYDKSHLVPFGEYVPIVGSIPGLSMIFKGQFFSAGPGPQTLMIGNYPCFSPLVCYEIIFPGAVTDSTKRPQWIFNVTNDAWYGYSIGPFQHLETARARAIEEGLPVVRVANTGVSAVFDPLGRKLGSIPLNQQGVLDINLPQNLSPTLYARYGRLGWVVLLVIATSYLGLLIWRSRYGHHSRD